ncbi:Sensory protein [Halanaeroarchaeum sp. HSR-CO]|uniref:methyl-accepting chemotaxis protein n=1 Tax=Halanaeroarchaeum sp. HSR-CO TaxID=2866382 RepID=UPI00217E50B7|nr:methyl-accepting chemotaxis protein [Halanaeroarchaeum sp. HSR-CO]UWG48461.1 Sensory protein [Halanaeroarchaeum sp. HSR-CO]
MGIITKLVDVFASSEAEDDPERETTPSAPQGDVEIGVDEGSVASEQPSDTFEFPGETDSGPEAAAPRTMTADGGTQTQALADQPMDSPGDDLPEPDRPELEVVLEDDPDQLFDNTGTALRVIDDQFNVAKQNRVMTEWTGVDAENEDLKCMNQMSGPVCGTENCTVKQLMEQGKQRVEVEIEKELANGETRETLLVSERITNARGEVVGITESFKDITDIKDAQSDVQESVSELTTAAEDVAESSEGISTTAEEMSGAMEEVTSEVANVSATVEEVASSAEEVAAVSNQAREQAEGGYETAEEAIDTMEDIDEAAGEVSADVFDLRNRVDEIDEIVELINDIADQTNLLALNANIEAARAGEEGDGFAVVANEVKNLAEESQEHAQTIESMIGGIKADTEETVESLEETTEEIDEGIDMVEETMERLEDVVAAIQEAANGVDEVADAADDQAASTEEVAAMIDEANAKAEDVAAEVQNIAAANEEQAQMVSDIEEAIGRLDQGM